MNTIPGFTAENSLSNHGTSYRMVDGGIRDGSSVVIPQLSCWRVCYGMSDTNNGLSDCFRVCSLIKSIFSWAGSVLSP